MANTWTEVNKYPTCDYCPDDATYDTKTTQGGWAYCCQKHWGMHGIGGGMLGTGIGQRLYLNRERSTRKDALQKRESLRKMMSLGTQRMKWQEERESLADDDLGKDYLIDPFDNVFGLHDRIW